MLDHRPFPSAQWYDDLHSPTLVPGAPVTIGEHDDPSALNTWYDVAFALAQHREHMELDSPAMHWWIDCLGIEWQEVSKRAGVMAHRIRNSSVTQSDLVRLANYLDEKRRFTYRGLYDAARAYIYSHNWPDMDAIRAAEDLLSDVTDNPILPAFPTIGGRTVTAPYIAPEPPRAMVCGKCGYEWRPRVPRPRACPNSKCQASFSWPDVPPVTAAEIARL